MAGTQWRGWLGFAALIGVIWGVLFVVLLEVYPIGVDWETAFYPAMQNFLTPYDIPQQKFVGFPWVLFLLPHGLLPIEAGNAVNFMLHLTALILLLRHYRGQWYAYVMVFTSFFFIDLVRTNNIDWIPTLALVLPPMWGLPLLIAKPQMVGGVALLWWKKAGFSPRLLVPTALVVLLAFVVWGDWLSPSLRLSGGLVNTFWNFSPFPFGVPIGIYLLYKGYREDNEVLAAAGTPFFAPYFAPYSLTPLFALLACRYPRMAFYLYVSFWFFFVVESRRLYILNTGG